MPSLGRFTHGEETRYQLYRMLCGPESPSGQVRKISPRAGIRSPDRPAHGESLYLLRYCGPLHNHLAVTKWWQVVEVKGFFAESSAGTRLIVLHAGSENGFFAGGQLLYFQS